jgi:hypothetical protein
MLRLHRNVFEKPVHMYTCSVFRGQIFSVRPGSLVLHQPRMFQLDLPYHNTAFQSAKKQALQTFNQQINIHNTTVLR